MTTIVVPPDLEAALVAQAQIEHTTPEQLALDTLRRHFLRPPAVPVESTGPTLEDFLKGLHWHSEWIKRSDGAEI